MNFRKGNKHIASFWNKAKDRVINFDNWATTVVHGIAEYNGNVYVVGEHMNNHHSIRACYWKLPIKTLKYPLGDAKEIYLLTKGDGWASDIVVSGDQLYISGSYFKSKKPENPVYWILKEDGTKSMTQLPKDLKTDALASSIDVDGSNLYLGGFQRDEEDNYIASYWKVIGGQKTVTRIGTPGIDSEVYDIDFYNGKVYSAGYESYKPVYWVDGLKVSLSTSGKGEARSIRVIDGKVVVAGNLGDQAAYWIDGELTSIDVKGSIVYAIDD